MATKRALALSRVFESPTGRARTSGDASAMAVEGIDAVVVALDAADALGDEYGTAARADVDRAVYRTGIALGETCVDGMTGMVIGEVVEGVVAPREGDEYFAPLDDSWQGGGAPYRAAAALALDQRGRLESLAAQPNQLFRRLAESVALAADLAAWSSWVEEDPAREDRGD